MSKSKFVADWRKGIGPTTLGNINRMLQENPHSTVKVFHTLYPHINISEAQFDEVKKHYCEKPGKEKRPYTKRAVATRNMYGVGWSCTVKDFETDSLKAFRSFLSSFPGRVKFELIKIEKFIEDKPVPYYEVREII